MLGAVIALRRGEHMRMTGLVSRVGPAARARCWRRLRSRRRSRSCCWSCARRSTTRRRKLVIVTPALEISNAWRAAALPVGIVLMLVAALLRLLRMARLARRRCRRSRSPSALVGAFWLAGPLLPPLGKLNLLIFFVGVVAA